MQMFPARAHVVCVIGCSALFLLATTPAGAAPSAARADASIVEVTVYRDRAEVVKEATVALVAGANAVEFLNLPAGVERDTIRVSGSGVAATLGAVTVRERADKPVETEEWKAARDEVRRIEGDIARLDRMDADGAKLRAFLESLGDTTASAQARGLGEGRADPAFAAEVYRLMEEKLAELGGQSLDRARRRRELHEQLAVARAKLQTLRPSGEIRTRSAVVDVEAPSAGSLTLRLAYLAPGASWRPSYRATLDAAGGEVALVSEGVVRQASGEDWSGVRLNLSTASPAVGVEPPMLEPWVLRPLQTRELEESVRGRASGDFAIQSERLYQNTLDLAPAGGGVPSERQETGLVRSAYNVAFAVPGRTDIPADGSEHRVVLRRETLPVNLVHRTVPGLEDRAYLTAVTTSPADYPLLAGPVRAFAGGAYFGSFPLQETGPGIELTLPFGVDNRIEIVRVPEPQSTGRGGLTGRFKVVERTHRTQIHNLLGREATLVVEERLPVAEDERIEIELGDETTPGFKDSPRRPGVKLWTLTLAPAEKRELRFDYTVKYPKELVLPGFD